jgi:hypothetical protein
MDIVTVKGVGPEIWIRAKINGVKTNSDVSTFGRVRIHKNKKLRRIHPNYQGYLMVNVRINKKNQLVGVHRLVAEAFVPNPENKPEVNHINGRKFDNRRTNLEWVTRSENILHAYKNGLIPIKREFDSCHNVYSVEEISKCIKLLKKKYTIPIVVESTGIKYDTVSHIYHGMIYQELAKSLGFEPVPWKKQFDFKPYEEKVIKMIEKGKEPNEIRKELPLDGLSDMQYNYHIRRLKSFLKKVQRLSK